VAELASTTHPKARKQHQCDYCAAPIPAGATYWRTSWLDHEFGFQTSTVCDDCRALERDLFAAGFQGSDEDGFDCWPYLPDFEDWAEVRALSPEWAARADAYLARRREAGERP